MNWPEHPMAMMANMPDWLLVPLGVRAQAAHHQRRQARSRAAHAMRADGYSISQIAWQLHISTATVSGYFANP